MPSRVRLSFKGIGEMLSSKEMQDEMLRRAKRVQAWAVANAPVDTGRDDDVPGAYKASIQPATVRVRRRPIRGGGIGNAAVASVKSDHPAAFQIEFGTGTPTGKRTPKHRTLGHALDAARD